VLLDAATGNEVSQGSSSITAPFEQNSTVVAGIGQNRVKFERAIAPR
jgi:hypothetical protein